MFLFAGQPGSSCWGEVLAGSTSQNAKTKQPKQIVAEPPPKKLILPMLTSLIYLGGLILWIQIFFFVLWYSYYTQQEPVLLWVHGKLKQSCNLQWTDVVPNQKQFLLIMVSIVMWEHCKPFSVIPTPNPQYHDNTNLAVDL
jgi:hypothetical protein